jgi:hypothetical protein
MEDITRNLDFFEPRAKNEKISEAIIKVQNNNVLKSLLVSET